MAAAGGARGGGSRGAGRPGACAATRLPDLSSRRRRQHALSIEPSRCGVSPGARLVLHLGARQAAAVRTSKSIGFHPFHRAIGMLPAEAALVPAVDRRLQDVPALGRGWEVRGAARPLAGHVTPTRGTPYRVSGGNPGHQVRQDLTPGGRQRLRCGQEGQGAQTSHPCRHAWPPTRCSYPARQPPGSGWRPSGGTTRLRHVPVAGEPLRRRWFRRSVRRVFAPTPPPRRLDKGHDRLLTISASWIWLA